MPRPETKYVDVGDHTLAYSVIGRGGGIDVVWVPILISHVEHHWEFPPLAEWMERVAGLGRLITYDRRGIGMSDSSGDDYALADEIDDLLAVLDAAGAGPVAVITQLGGGALSCLFAATHPERVTSLVLDSCFARTAWAEDYDWAAKPDQRAAVRDRRRQVWGSGAGADMFIPSLAGDERAREWLGRLERLATGPSGMSRVHSYLGEADVRGALPAIRAPTLVTRRTHDALIDRRHAVYLAEQIEGARLFEFPGRDPAPFTGPPGDTDRWLDEIGEFIAGRPLPPRTTRMPMSLLFTDIVGSTEMLAAIGDPAWRELLQRHDAVTRAAVARHRGREIKALGDGFFAAFDSPEPAVGCGLDLLDATADLGLALRAGVHSGECETLGDDLAGLTVHEAARISAAAGQRQLLVSEAVRADCSDGSFRFADQGERMLKGLPDPYRLWAVETTTASRR